MYRQRTGHLGLVCGLLLGLSGAAHARGAGEGEAWLHGQRFRAENPVGKILAECRAGAFKFDQIVIDLTPRSQVGNLFATGRCALSINRDTRRCTISAPSGPSGAFDALAGLLETHTFKYCVQGSRLGLAISPRDLTGSTERAASWPAELWFREARQTLFGEPDFSAGDLESASVRIGGHELHASETGAGILYSASGFPAALPEWIPLQVSLER
ncbi:MAG: hypothetical protein IT371_07720 [Deltaproteobacteria bacterium]|nr:hypothetical protein [Deltaproteobacteria bacterium]